MACSPDFIPLGNPALWDRHKHRHPLLLLFDYARMDEHRGMNWLQDRGYISDNCIGVFDVAPCDVERVLRLHAESRRARREGV